MKDRAYTKQRWAISTLAAAGVVAMSLTMGAGLPAYAVGGSTASSTVTDLDGSETLWGSQEPTGASVDNDRNSVELGTAFTASTPGEVAGVRFWKTAENRGTHVGNLWDSSGAKLATATFASETTSGWQTVLFSKPVSINAGGPRTR